MESQHFPPATGFAEGKHNIDFPTKKSAAKKKQEFNEKMKKGCDLF